MYFWLFVSHLDHSRTVEKQGINADINTIVLVLNT